MKGMFVSDMINKFVLFHFLSGLAYSLPYSSWLSAYQGTRLVDLPVIPGTHNSGAVQLGNDPTWQGEAMWDYAQTQNSSISDQLSLGVRMLDLRLHVMYNETDFDNQIRISHTYDSNITISDVLQAVSTFLAEQSSEFVVLYMRIDSAYPLKGDVAAKHKFIEFALSQSGITFASYKDGDLKSLTVRDIAGKALLMGIPGDAFDSSSALYDFVNSETNYSVCDIWEVQTITAAQSKLSNCFPEIPESGQLTGNFTGYAIDGQLDGLPPSDGSVQMNSWFFNNFDNNPIWVNRKNYPIGILLIDFANSEYMTSIIDYAISADVTINYQSSTLTATNAGSNKHVPVGVILLLLALLLHCQ